MDQQVRNDLLLDSIARKESQHQELERMVLDRDSMITTLQGMVQQRDEKIRHLEQMVANAQGTPADLSAVRDAQELDAEEIEVVGSNGRDRLPG